MASTLSVKLIDATTVTYTPQPAATDVIAAKTAAQRLGSPAASGFWDDAGVFHPATAIVSVTVNP